MLSRFSFGSEGAAKAPFLKTQNEIRKEFVQLVFQVIRRLRRWLAAAARRRDGGLRNRPERSPAPAQRAQLKPGLIGGPITHPLKGAI